MRPLDRTPEADARTFIGDFRTPRPPELTSAGRSVGIRRSLRPPFRRPRHLPRDPPMSSPLLDPPDRTLERVADLRARGSSWEAAADRLDADPDLLRQQVRDAGSAYRALSRAARREVVEEACAEALLALR